MLLIMNAFHINEDEYFGNLIHTDMGGIIREFCLEDGTIDWKQPVEFNSDD